MSRTTPVTIVVALALAVAGPVSARAACSAGPYTVEFVQYYSASYPLPPFDQRNETAESICDIEHSKSGQRICKIKLWGALYEPIVDPDQIFAQFPALIFNHGSGPVPDATFCEVGKYFAERGYIVLIPFRRGQGDPTPNDHLSSGTYAADVLDDFVNDPAHHNTTCTTKDCYTAELLRLQADEEVVFARDYLWFHARVKKDRNGDAVFAVGGNSWGGAVTVFFNRKDHRQRAVLAFSPASQYWEEVNFAYAAEGWILGTGLTSRRTLVGALLPAAIDATHPAFYLQAKWDYDTRATIDLAYAHAYGGDDPTHGHRFMASIFPYKKFVFENGEVDYQSAHTGFIRATEQWGPSALAFLKLYGVH